MSRPYADGQKPRSSSVDRLSEGQQRALQAAEQGASVFFTGCGGSGKSFLLGRILEELRKKLGDRAVFCTAMTGASAAAIGGGTLHAFAGIGRGEGSAEDLAKMARRGEARSRWEKCKVLSIDEVSMMDGELFQKLEYVARRVRNKQQPFGGIQLILCGDLFQLPPINAKKLVFQSEAWRSCVQLHLELDVNYRQKDGDFSALLSRVRTGASTPFDTVYLQRLSRPLKERVVADEDGRDFVVIPTRLYATNVSVSAENGEALLKLPGPTVRFEADDSGMRPEVLEKGIFVLHRIASYDARTQKKGALARSQARTRPRPSAHVVVRALFAQYISPTMLQQCAAPATLLLRVGAQVMLVKNINSKSGLVNGARGVVVAFNQDWANAPLVVFNGGNGREVLLPAEEFAVFQDGHEVACRLQIPLQLAWALTIHKAQGATLDRAIVDLKSVQNAGQAYVALSRVRCSEELQIINFAPERLKVDPRVKEFMKWVAKEGGKLRPQVVLKVSDDVDDEGWTSVKRSKTDKDDF